MHCVDRYDLPR
jgi:hypothetical protein